MKMINAFVFLNESLLEIETNIWHAPCTGKSNFTSRAYFRCFFFPSFIFLFFFSRQNWLLPKIPLLLFFGLFPLFQKWFHTMSSVLSLQRQRKRTIHGKRTFGSQAVEIKIMKNGVNLLWALKQNCFFLSITKRIEKARYSSKSFTELSLTRSSSLW